MNVHTPNPDRDEGRDDFPRRYAVTRGFSLGRPRSFSISDDGQRIAFLRSPAADDPANRLYVYDLDAGGERLVADPSDLPAGGDLPQEERARRERVRESGEGIVAYAGDRTMETIAFAWGGEPFLARVGADSTQVVPLETGQQGVIDPRPSPDGTRIAFVCGGGLHVVDREGREEAVLAASDDEDVRWGLAEFIAAEEMGRSRGYWWAPDGSRLVVSRVDESPVSTWYIANPVEPSQQPAAVHYPAAGTANADVSLWLVNLDGSLLEVRWDHEAFPYLGRVRWDPDRPLTLLVQSRDQRHNRILTVDEADGQTTVVADQHDDAWLDLVGGTPAWTPDGRLVTTVEQDDTRRLAVDGDPITAPGIQIRQVVAVDEDGILVVASADPVEAHLARVDPGTGETVWLTAGAGVFGAAASGGTLVVSGTTLRQPALDVQIRRAGTDVGTIEANASVPDPEPSVRLLELGDRKLRGALLMPPGDGPCPVLLDPYGGPHAQRVTASAGAYLVPCWFARAGFAVLVVDGRGTPGRGPSWERAVHGDLAAPVLEDQVDALHAAAEVEPRLDLARVGIRGWSFGGYLAALAVLRRPDLFHAAIAGAPVADWRLYDTHYTERYLGHPDTRPDAYARTSLIEAVRDAGPPTDGHPARPLLIIHGLADDNVVAAHSLRLSRALLEAGRPHTFLPLSGVTHMTPQEVVTENLLRLNLRFLEDALGPSR